MKTGDELPLFTATDQNGEVFNSSAIKGKNALVVFFYPADFTPTCTKEACSFRDNYNNFEQYGAKVIGISNNGENSHKKFSTQYHLNYPLLTDKEGKIAMQFGIAKYLGIIPRRATFIFNKEGKLLGKYENFFQGDTHIQNALSKLKEYTT